MNILFATNSYPPAIGGAEKVCLDIVSLLHDAKHSVTVLTQPRKDRIIDFNDKNRMIVQFPATTSYSKMSGLPDFLDNTKTSFDLYISFGYGKYFSDYIGKWCHNNHKKFIYMPCGDFHTKSNKIFKFIYSMFIGKTTFEIADAIITATEWEKQHWIEKYNIPANKMHVIPYRLESSFATFKETDILKKNKLKNNDYILYIGRTGPNKRIDLLIKSYIDSEVKTPLVIAGLNTENLKPLAEKHGILREDIKFLGEVSEDDKKTLIKNARVCVFPSNYESFGLVVLECTALGCPVLLSNIPPFRELVNDNTLFFENNVDSLSTRLQAYLSINRHECPQVNVPTDMQKLLWLVDGIHKSEFGTVCAIKTFRTEKK